MSLCKIPGKNHKKEYDLQAVSKFVDLSPVRSPVEDKKESKESWIKCRYITILFAFAGEFYLNTHRTGMAIAIVSMVNNSALSTEEMKSGACPELITNTSLSGDVSEKDGEFLWSPELQGYVLGCSFLCYMIGAAPIGKLCDLYGCKKVYLWGFFLSNFFTFISPFAAWFNVYALILIQSLRGLSQAGFVPTQSALIANWCPIQERGFSYTIVLTGASWGSVVGCYISGLLCNTSLLGGWPLQFFFFGGTGIIVSVFMKFFLHDNPSVHPTISQAELKYILENQETVLTKKRPETPWCSMFTSVPVYALAYAYFGQMWAISHFVSEHSTFLGTILHYPIEENGLFSALPFLLQFLTALGSGSLSIFLEKNNYMSVNTNRKFWNSMSCIGYSACLFGIYFVGCNRDISVVLAMAAFAFAGFGYSGCWISSTDMTPTFAASLNGISCTVGFSSYFILPVVVGFLTDGRQTLEEWNKFFFISMGVVMSSGLIFAVFGSAKIQPWNSTEEKDEKTRF